MADCHWSPDRVPLATPLLLPLIDHLSIKKSNGKPPRKTLNPWWNDQCQRVTEESRKAWYAWQKKPTPANKATYNRAETKSKKTILVAKRATWDAFCKKIDFQTSRTVIARINGKITKQRDSLDPEFFEKKQEKSRASYLYPRTMIKRLHHF